MIEEAGIASELGVPGLYIKHESCNPTGSHKDRSLWSMMAHYIDEGREDFVISSSGNAAISAAYFVAQLEKPVALYIYISENIDPKKRVRLERAVGDSVSISIEEHERPKQKAFQHAKETGAVFLRASQDDAALVGYAGLADEILRQAQIDKISAVFVPTSSGTTAQGLYNGFVNPPLSLPPKKGEMPAIHVVQTERVHPIAGEFDTDFGAAKESLDSCVVDPIAHRKEEVVASVKNSGGSGWVVSDSLLEEARELYILRHSGAKAIESSGIEKDPIVQMQDLDSRMTQYEERVEEPSWDSLLSLAGLIKAQRAGMKFDRSVVCLFTGV